MSYDIYIYGRSALSTAELRELIQRDSTLRVQVDETGATVSTKRTLYQLASKYRFTIEGPLDVEVEDIPPARRNLVGSRRVLYTVLVEGGSSGDIPGAVTFASTLAQRIEGISIDAQQEGAEEQDVTEEEPRKDTMWLHFVWFRLRDNEPQFARDFIISARRLFPLAVPVRFGAFEPMQGRLTPESDGKFGEYYARECDISSLMFANGKRSWGRITGWSKDVAMRYTSARVAVRLDAAAAAGLLDASEEFLLSVAENSASFFAFSEVNSSEIFTAEAGDFEGGWSGLPADPPWLSWYGPEYAELVASHLAGGDARSYAGGIVHRLASGPAPRENLRTSEPEGAWIDQRLLPRVDGSRVREPAALVPLSLLAPAPGSPEALRLEAIFAERRSKSRPV